MAYGPYDFPCVSSLYKNDQHQQNSNSRNCFGGLIKKHLFPSHPYDFVCVCVCVSPFTLMTLCVCVCVCMFHLSPLWLSLCMCVCVCACFTSHPYDFLCVSVYPYLVPATDHLSWMSHLYSTPWRLSQAKIVHNYEQFIFKKWTVYYYKA